MKLAGRTALVTGAARGLGRAYALRLGALGADVAIVDIDLNSAAVYGEALSAPTVADEIRALGRRGIGIQADVSDRGAVDEAVRRTLAELGRIDILVNNAGGAITPIERSRASTIPDEDIRVTLDANLMSTVHCCQAVLPGMRAQGSGVIVNIASLAALTPNPRGNLAFYGAAKAAVATYTRYLATEVGPDGIRVNCIAPGVMQTARLVAQAAARGIGTPKEAARIPLRRLGVPEDCANVLEFLATDLSAYVTGQVISVCGGAVLTPS